jgi:broad specificity phosphatase PhoE
MLRARKTALAIQARHPDVPLRIDRGINEILSGWQGQRWKDMAASIGRDFYARPHSPDDETILAMRDRMLGWVQRMLRRHSGQEVVGVSHGDPVLIAVAALRGVAMDAAHFRPTPYIPTATVFQLRFDAANQFLGAEMTVPHQLATV